MSVVAFPNAPVRQPPHNVDLEAALLGTLLRHNAVLPQICNVIEKETFFEPLHQAIWDVASSLIAKGLPATPVTIQTYLGQHDLGGVTIPQYMARLAQAGAPAHSIVECAGMVRDLAARRRLIDIAAHLTDTAYDLPVQTPVDQVISDATTDLLAIASSEAAQNTMRAPSDSLEAIIARAQDLRDGKIKPRGVPTTIPDLDHATGGFQPGTLWIAGARPGMGKTVFATSMAVKAAKQDCGALIFSLEVPELQIMARVAADLAYRPGKYLPFGEIIRGSSLTDYQIDRLCEAQRDLAGLPLRIDVASRLTVAQITMRVRAAKKQMAAKGQRLSVIFLDYLKMIQASDRYKSQRVYEVGEISGALKQLAKDEDLCVVLLVQLNRALENREDKRPTLSDIRESGDLEADADVVCFIHRESYFIERSPEYRARDPLAVAQYRDVQHAMELILGKNRAGECGVHQVWCDMGASKIETRGFA